MTNDTIEPEPIREMNIDDYSKKIGKRSRDRFVSDYAKLIEFMTASRLHEDTRREILYQAIRMYSGHNGYFDHTTQTFISKDAEQHCNERGKPRGKGLVVKEHVIPISVSIECLWEASEMPEPRLQTLLNAASTVCIVSKKDDQRLRDAGFKSSMPSNDWKLDTHSVWERYEDDKVKMSWRPLLGIGDNTNPSDGHTNDG
jgi:hypothetical protein